MNYKKIEKLLLPIGFKKILYSTSITFTLGEYDVMLDFSSDNLAYTLNFYEKDEEETYYFNTESEIVDFLEEVFRYEIRKNKIEKLLKQNGGF